MTDDEIRKLIDERDNLRAERDYYRKKLDEERKYIQYCQEHRLKGYIAGHVTRCMGMFMIEHGLAEEIENIRASLRKLANNPAISPDFQNVLDKAAMYLSMYMDNRRRYYDLLNSDKHLRHIAYRKMIAKQRAEGE